MPDPAVVKAIDDALRSSSNSLLQTLTGRQIAAAAAVAAGAVELMRSEPGEAP